MAPKTAVVVEDDKGIQALLRDALENDGFQVVVEGDGDAALKALTRRLPDLLVTDILLPGLGGFELIEGLRRLPGGEHVAVIAISGIYRGQRHKRMAADKLGVLAYFDKPFEVQALRVAVADALGSERATPAAKPSTVQQETTDARAAPTNVSVSALKGNLKQRRFAEVLAALYRNRATGALLLKKDSHKKILYLKEGYPIFIKSNLMSECLGRVLVREKMISEEECEKSLLLMRDTGRQQGTTLIEMGCISPHNLVFALQLQLEQKLFDVFAWPDGDFQFNAKIELPTQTIHLDMSIATIVYEGVRRKVTDAATQQYLEPFWDSYLLLHPDPAQRFQELSLEADERKMLALADGRRTAREVLERSALRPPHARQLLYTMLATETLQAHVKPPLPDALAAAALTGVAAPRPPPLKRRTDDAGGADGDALRIKLVERARTLKRQSLFEMLGVSRSAAVDEIRRAYHALAREIHPDRLRGNVPADARALADQIAQHLQQAYEVLTDPARHADYVRRLNDGLKAGISDDLSRILTAEGRFKKGEALLKSGRYEEASAQFMEAVSFYPQEGEFHAHLGWSMYLCAPDDEAVRAQAGAHIAHGIKLSPRLDKGYLFLGRVHTRAGRVQDAQRHFEQALVCNPDSSEALAELRLQSVRARPQERV